MANLDVLRCSSTRKGREPHDVLCFDTVALDKSMMTQARKGSACKENFFCHISLTRPVLSVIVSPAPHMGIITPSICNSASYPKVPRSLPSPLSHCRSAS
jgi:hypothetical protein